MKFLMEKTSLPLNDHVAAPIITRNTPIAATVATAAGTQIRQHPLQQQRQPQNLHQMDAINLQQMNPEIIRHIIVGNPLLQNKTAMQQQQKQFQQQQQNQPIHNSQVSISSSSKTTHSSDQIKLETKSSPLLRKTLMEEKPLMPKEEGASSSNEYSSAFEMLSNFNMLNWKERIGSARGTNLKFQLNDYNLLQVYEVGHNRDIRIAYDKPIHKRETKVIPLGINTSFYKCRRCNVQAPATLFLTSEFCSLSCVRHISRDDNTQENVNNTNQPRPFIHITSSTFNWPNFLETQFKSVAAPISLFLNPLPTRSNKFKVGMKLEAIDPKNCSIFCVCTVIETMGYRIKLNFDGYESSYDFWCNADSVDIFPAGWCLKTNRILQPPRGISGNKFIWDTYLKKKKALAAPDYFFTHINPSFLKPRNPFKVGMYLEAEDINDNYKLCVASIADLLDDRIRIHFDGWDDCHDIIVNINSPYIHPCGWHEGRQQLVVPPDCENTAFNWDDYIRKQGNGEAASEEIFVPREPINFKTNMKLEVVDPRNPSLIRPATVVTHKGHRVNLHLDGWPIDYCFWMDDNSPDLHPTGWCDTSGHDLEPPPGFKMDKQKLPCPVAGCRGIGNAKKPFISLHASRDCCPYAAENWSIIMERPKRLDFDDIIRALPKHGKITSQTQPQKTQRISDQHILENVHVLDTIKTRNVLAQQEKLPTNHNDVLELSSSIIKKEEEPKETEGTKIKTSTSKLSLPNTSSSSSSMASISNKNSDVAKEFLSHFGARLQQTYTLWQNNFNFDVDKIKCNPLKWSTAEVSAFVEMYLDCRQTATIFNQEDIDGEALLLLQQEDLTKLGLKLGAAVKLYACIVELRILAVTNFDVPYKLLNK